MTDSTVRFVHDKAGNVIEVILPIATYRALLDELEDLQATLEFDEAMAAGETPIPFEEVVARIEGEPVAEVLTSDGPVRLHRSGVVTWPAATRRRWVGRRSGSRGAPPHARGRTSHQRRRKAS